MNPLTEMMFEQKTRWADSYGKEIIRKELMESVERSGEVVRIEDDLYPDGRVSQFGSRVIERRFYFANGRCRFINTFRLQVSLDPLPKNPLTLADVEGGSAGERDHAM